MKPLPKKSEPIQEDLILYENHCTSCKPWKSQKSKTPHAKSIEILQKHKRPCMGKPMEHTRNRWKQLKPNAMHTKPVGIHGFLSSSMKIRWHAYGVLWNSFGISGGFFRFPMGFLLMSDGFLTVFYRSLWTSYGSPIISYGSQCFRMVFYSPMISYGFRLFPIDL